MNLSVSIKVRLSSVQVRSWTRHIPPHQAQLPIDNETIGCEVVDRMIKCTNRLKSTNKSTLLIFKDLS
ncbi:hypothetical protein RHMOL_Rhmol09G0025600 [Rhododendron molle]|uniref:Uncharacterized protein n=1 Tax=Rhododendron molle TaxID=49168 RepID=A0ACC0M8Z0_RHOML|nr:hypothetical protein RHMOL_Rhmol09G0025600 [Rhododendron molle]